MEDPDRADNTSALPITGGDVAILLAVALAIALIGGGLRIADRQGGARRPAP
jgi:hypothetical protein